jgi:hypothetical protein
MMMRNTIMLDLTAIAADLATLQARRVDDNPMPWIEASTRLSDVHAAAMYAEIERLTLDLAAANETVARLRAALRIYANPDNWERRSMLSDDFDEWVFEVDGAYHGYVLAMSALVAAEEGETIC